MLRFFHCHYIVAYIFDETLLLAVEISSLFAFSFLEIFIQAYKISPGLIPFHSGGRGEK